MVMVTHESGAALRHFLPAQVEAARAADIPFAVADNASTDDTLALLERAAARYDGISVTRLQANRGYAAGVNAAAALVPDRDPLVLNPDVDLGGSAAIDRLSAELAARPRAALVAPRLLDPGGGVQESARRFPTPLSFLGALPRLSRIPPMRRARARYVSASFAAAATAVDWVIGAAMLIRRRAFDQVGGWDERYFLYAEDVDFCLRCRRAGWSVVYLPEVAVRHEYDRASGLGHGSVLRSHSRRRHVLSLARLFAHHPGLLVGRSGGNTAATPLPSGDR